jgi:RNA polymerase sigma-70 factor (ECF subfamily)
LSRTAGASEAALVDEDLVALVLRGREDLYAELMRRYQRKLMAHVIRMVRNREDALEIVQDAFVKAYKHLARYDRKFRFSTWIYSIASNTAIDHLRRKRIKTVSLDEPLRFDDSELAREPEGPARTAEEIHAGRELLELVDEAITQLPPAHRELLLLRHPGNRSYDEIATMTKLPLGTVKNRIFRAREKLREILGDALPEGT